MRLSRLLSTALVCGLLACAADKDEPGGSGGGGGTGSGGGSGGSSGGGTRPDAGSTFTECADTRAGAERGGRGSNVVWVVDNSGSMDEEARFVQENLNRFVTSVTASGLSDYRVMLMTEREFVQVPNPLGSDSEHFLHIEEDVGSEEPLSDLIKRFSAYKDFLLPGVVTHFVVVTDDESEIAATRFVSEMTSLIGANFRVHAIASPPGEMPPPSTSVPLFPWGDDDDDDKGCVGTYGAAAQPGIENFEAAKLTMGRTFSICSEDWSALFGELASEVSASAAVPCTVDLPAPPAGKALDFSLVNVLFTEPDADDGEALPRVDGATSCGNKRGWYYDDFDAPSDIVLCPSSCQAAEEGGSLEISLGCATIGQ